MIALCSDRSAEVQACGDVSNEVWKLYAAMAAFNRIILCLGAKQHIWMTRAQRAMTSCKAAKKRYDPPRSKGKRSSAGELLARPTRPWPLPTVCNKHTMAGRSCWRALLRAE